MPVFRSALLAAGALMLAFAAPAQAAAPNAAEKAMIVTVDAEANRHVKLLEDLVRVNSGTMNLKGVEQVGRMMRAELEPLGFEVKWVPMGHIGRAGHIVATHKGDGRGKRLLLIGHLDTVFEPDSPFQGWTRKGDIVEGPGVGDDKGGMVVIVAALRAMQAAGTLKDADITVVLTGDEEKPGAPIEVARADLIAAGRASDVALEFEGLSRVDGRDMGTIARRSAASWTLKTRAPSGHSSGVCMPAAGCGAIYELTRILDAFRRELPEKNLTYNVGIVVGGAQARLNEGLTNGQAAGKSNIIAGEAMALGDIRTLTPEQDARVRARMQAIVAQNLDKAQAELTFLDGAYPPMAPTPGNQALLDKLNAVNATLGLPAMPAGDPASRGAADSSFTAFIDSLAGLGPAGQGAHAAGESVDLSSIPLQAKRAALLMTRLSREPRAN